MKTRKVLFCLSAISLTLYSVWEIIRQTPLLDSWYSEHIWGNPLRVEIYWLPYTWLYLGGILLALVASLCTVRESAQPITKLHKYSTIVLSILSLFVTIWGIVHAVQIYGFGFLYVPTWVRIVVAIAGCAWLWLIVFRPANQQLPKSLRSLIWLGIGLISLIWVLQLASGISYLTTGHILMFRTHAFGNWLRYLVPTILLCSYSLFLLDKWPSAKLVQLHQTRNNHCTPGSDMERIYPTMRILAFVFMGLTFVAFYCMMMWMNCFIFHDYAVVAGRTLAVLVFISWLLLTFIAFFQLPNPRGYKVFNWIFLVLNLCLPIGLVISILFEGHAPADTIGELMGLTGLFAVIFYLLWTFVRVVLYKLPKLQGIDKLKDIELKEGAIILN